MSAALNVEQLFDSLAVRLDGPRAWEHSLTLHWHLSDLGEMYRMTLHNGVLVHTRTTRPADNADLSLTLTKPQLLALLAGKGLHGVYHSGDLDVLDTLLSLLDDNAPDFAIVTP